MTITPVEDLSNSGVIPKTRLHQRVGGSPNPMWGQSPAPVRSSAARQPPLCPSVSPVVTPYLTSAKAYGIMKHWGFAHESSWGRQASNSRGKGYQRQSPLLF